MLDAEQEMRHAIDEWLAAREKFHTHGRGYLAAYSAADVRLLEAFASDWAPGDHEMFATAYQGFRAAIVANAPSDTEPFGAVGGCSTWRNK